MYAKTYQLSVEQGRQSAEQVANAPETVANPIIVYSVNDLAITGPDVSVTTMGYGESGFHFRYYRPTTFRPQRWPVLFSAVWMARDRPGPMANAADDCFGFTRRAS